MRKLHLVVVMALLSSRAFAQLATPAGNEVNGSIGSYKYVEPGTTSISIHGPKFAGEYTGTLSLSQNRHWFA